MDAFWNIGLGIVSGIMTSALLWVLVRLIQEVALPRYREFKYQGFQVDGEWKVYSERSAQDGYLLLTQRAERLDGSLTFTAKPDAVATEFEQVRRFKVSGRIADRIVELSFRHENPSRLGAGVLLLEVVRDGRVMEGVQVQYSAISGKIHSVEVTVSRPEVTPPQPVQLDVFTGASDRLVVEGLRQSRKERRGRKAGVRAKRDGARERPSNEGKAESSETSE